MVVTDGSEGTIWIVVEGAEAINWHSSDTFWPIVDTLTGIVEIKELVVVSTQSIVSEPSSWLVKLMAKVYVSPS